MNSFFYAIFNNDKFFDFFINFKININNEWNYKKTMLWNFNSWEDSSNFKKYAKKKN